jgi:long-chain acyl-CoA synthetase
MISAATSPQAELSASTGVGANYTIPTVFFDLAELYGDRPYLHYFRDHEWQTLSWAETARRALRVAYGLVRAGLRRGDTVALMSPNRPGWLYCDLGIMAAGGITVPIYPTLTRRAVASIASDSRTSFGIVSNTEMASMLNAAPHASIVFGMDDEIAGWVASEPDLEVKQELDARVLRISQDSVATIIYTSGTSGDPKGVVLTHRHFMDTARSCLKVFSIGPDDVILSYLPYSHVMERVDGTFIPTTAGATVWLVRGASTLIEDIQVARPTIMLGVPRVFEKVYEGVYDQVRNQPVVKRALFRWALAVGAEKASGGWLPGIKVRMSVADSLVLRQLRLRLTGGRLRFFISGGAPLHEKVEEFFWALGIKILQGWGLTETTSAVTSKHGGGTPLPNCGHTAPRYRDSYRP